MKASPDDWAEGPGLLASIGRYKALVAVMIVGCAVLAYGWSSRQPVQYAGVVRIFVDRAGPQPADPGRLVQNRAEFLQSPLVMEEAVRILGGHQTVEQLQRRVAIAAESDADVIKITALGGTRAEAAKLANSVALGYRRVVTRQAEAAGRAMAAQLQTVENRLARELQLVRRQRSDRPDDLALAVDEQAKREQLLVVAKQKEAATADAVRAAQQGSLPEDAAVSDRPVKPRPLHTSGLGAAIGLVIGAGLAWWLAGREGKTRPQEKTAGGTMRRRLAGSRTFWQQPLGSTLGRDRQRGRPSLRLRIIGPSQQSGGKIIEGWDGRHYEVAQFEGVWRVRAVGTEADADGGGELFSAATEKSAYTELDDHIAQQPPSASEQGGRRWAGSFRRRVATVAPVRPPPEREPEGASANGSSGPNTQERRSPSARRLSEDDEPIEAFPIEAFPIEDDPAWKR